MLEELIWLFDRLAPSCIDALGSEPLRHPRTRNNKRNTSASSPTIKTARLFGMCMGGSQRKGRSYVKLLDAIPV